MREALLPPVACAACGGQYPRRRHVDFEVAYDGPTFSTNPDDPANPLRVAIDDLVICEDCMEAAANVLGFVKDAALRDENKELGQLLEEREAEIARLNKHVRDLTFTVDYVAKHPPKTEGGRPAVRIPTPEEIERMMRESGVPA